MACTLPPVPRRRVREYAAANRPPLRRTISASRSSSENAFKACHHAIRHAIIKRMACVPSRSPPSLIRYLARAMRLRCPECGISPLFVKFRNTRSVRDWFTPLDGCPRCGYAYEREDGYFLVAIWGVHYFVVAGAGLVAGLMADLLFRVSLIVLVSAVCVPMVLFGFFFARWSKAIYLAIDHFIDPHCN